MNFSEFFLSKRAELFENNKDTIKQLALDQKENHFFLESLIPFSTEPYKVIQHKRVLDFDKELKFPEGIYPSANWIAWEEKALPNKSALEGAGSLPCLIELKTGFLEEDIFYQMRLRGFDACLLDAASICLQDLQFHIEILMELGMDSFIKVSSIKALQVALASDGKIIGIDWTHKDCLEQRVQLEKQIKIYGCKRIFVSIRDDLSFELMKQDLQKGFLAFCLKSVQR